LNDLELDRVTRWQPDPRAVAHARAILAAEGNDPDVLVAIPMYQPGKELGIWEMGQEVRTVMGAVFAGYNRSEDTGGLPFFSWARAKAAEVAEAELGEGAGTVAFAVVRAGSDATPVFEW
jgi:hypothetical protein